MAPRGSPHPLARLPNNNSRGAWGVTPASPDDLEAELARLRFLPVGRGRDEDRDVFPSAKGPAPDAAAERDRVAPGAPRALEPADGPVDRAPARAARQLLRRHASFARAPPLQISELWLLDRQGDARSL